jgi:phenylalanyl-tRNA synthetase beta chain
MRDTGPSLIIKELEAHLPNMQLVSFTDVYPEPTYAAEIEFNLTHINKLIGKEYSREVALNILDSIFVVLKGDMLEIPLWRKDLTNIADIAEEIARLDGYDKVEMTVPRINLGAITQNPLYIAKREIRNFLVSK